MKVTMEGAWYALDAHDTSKIVAVQETLVKCKEAAAGRPVEFHWVPAREVGWTEPDIIQRDIEFAGYVRGVRFGVFITVGFILALGAAVRIGVAIWEMVR